MIHRHWDTGMLVLFLLSAMIGVMMCYLVMALLTILTLGIDWVSALPLHDWLVPLVGSVSLIIFLRLLGQGRLFGVIDLHQYIHTHQPRRDCSQQISTRIVLVSTLLQGWVLAFGSISGVLGPLVFATTHLAQLIGLLFRRNQVLPHHAENDLMSAAAAATITAAFNAPFAAIFFGLEVIHRRPSLRRLMPVMIASISSSITMRLQFQDIQVLSDLPFVIAEPWEYAVFCLMGAVIGIASVFFAYNLDVLRRTFAQLSENARCFTPLFGGISVGALLLFWPEGSPRLISLTILPQLLGDQQQMENLLILLPLFWLGVIASVGSGFGLGLLGPSLVLGALIGGVFWTVLPHVLGEGLTISALGVYALVGMAAMSAALLGAPIFAFIFAFEISLSYSMTTAVMISSLIASQMMMILGARSIFHYLCHDYRR